MESVDMEAKLEAPLLDGRDGSMQLHASLLKIGNSVIKIISNPVGPRQGSNRVFAAQAVVSVVLLLYLL